MRLISFLKKIYQNGPIFRIAEKVCNQNYRNRLQNDRFSILCSNCIGGIIYHRLGKPFLSPTVNMHMSNTDFVLFCVNLDSYLQGELEFIPSDQPFPVALLPGGGTLPPLKLFFNHSRNADEARADWNRRRTRINRDNLYLILYNLDGVDLQTLRFLETVPCKNKVIFTATPLPGISWACCIKPHRNKENAECYLDRNLLGIRTFEKHFDFVSWLNNSDNGKIND